MMPKRSAKNDCEKLVLRAWHMGGLGGCFVGWFGKSESLGCLTPRGSIAGQGIGYRHFHEPPTFVQKPAANRDKLGPNELTVQHINASMI